MPHVYTIDGAPVGRPTLVGSGVGAADQQALVESYRTKFWIASGAAATLGLLGFIFGFMVGRK